MQNEMSRLQILGETMANHGTELVVALIVLISGLLAARWIHKRLSQGMRRLYPKSKAAPLACNSIYIIVIAITIMGTAVQLGAQPVILFRLVAIIALIVIGTMVFLRPFLPTLPFKVGNNVKAGDLLGKVEAITFLNTRMKTFDGKTFFVPNRQILNEIIINYHFTQTRRVKINVSIRYDQDLLKAKQTLEKIMIEDSRVKIKPSPVVYVMNLATNSVDLGGRCWVANKDFWFARCDLLEKTKLRFDREGIQFAFPQLDLHIESNELQMSEISQSIGKAQPVFSSQNPYDETV
ncbi:MAG: mechanosensitive ion channel family protein [Desulfobacula sp.]|nr:mechanosensitive ion channel family protein [Desulfobacula sp.]